MKRTPTLSAPDHVRTPDTSPAKELPLPSHGDVARDVEIALALADARLSGDTARAIRESLRDRIRALTDPAEAFARAMEDSRPRDVAIATVRYARHLAEHPGDDLVASLRLLAKSAQHLARYAADGRTAAARGRPGPLHLRAAS
ncbi:MULTISPECIES: hypothetical protein [unclassified Streptomyces]|uniref:hypothetical protein n=1 Tax=unclassified Streptomyces TaxID=2593676 RepID=UPI0036629166